MVEFDLVTAWCQLLERRLQAFVAYQHQPTHDTIDWHVPPHWRDDLLAAHLPPPGDPPEQLERLVELRLISGESRLLLIHIAFAPRSAARLHLRLTYLTTLIALETDSQPLVSVLSAESGLYPDGWHERAGDESGDDGGNLADQR